MATKTGHKKGKQSGIRNEVVKEKALKEKEAVNDSLLLSLKSDIIALYKDNKEGIQGIYEHVRSTPDKRYTAKLSAQVYALVERYDKKGLRVDGKKVSLLMVVNALMIYNVAKEYRLTVITNEDLDKKGNETLKLFYQSIRAQKKIKREQEGKKKVIPIWKRHAVWFLNADTREKEKFMAFTGLIWTRGKVVDLRKAVELKKAA
jgi:hypothetical protein